MKRRFSSGIKGISLVETLIGLAVFVVISVSVYQAYTILFRTFSASRLQVLAAQIANEELEVIRNIPYENVGTVGGVPAGVVPPVQTVIRDATTFVSTTTIRNIDDPFDGTQGKVPNDPSPADYKLVEIRVSCLQCMQSSPFIFTGRIAPKNLETASTKGSLFIQAINANGQPVSGATVQVVNNSVNPPVNITDVTGMDGTLRIIDVMPANQSYQITVSKFNYSTDKTYDITVQNPNPIRPHATVVAQNVTQASFAIDQTSILNISSVTQTCEPIPNVPVSLKGSKLIGRTPDILKYPSTPFLTGGGASVFVAGLEWDTYSATTSQQGGYSLAGTIPLSPFSLSPGATKNFKLVMTPTAAQAFLVTVRDSATGLPLTGATVVLGASALVTGRGFLRQTDWSGGGGQQEFSNQAMYAADDGHVDVVGSAGEVKLKQQAGGSAGGGDGGNLSRFSISKAFAGNSGSTGYAPSGYLISSTFDTGSPSSFFDFAFQPTSQPPAVGQDSVRFQLAATNTPGATSWDFRGPDGTAQTYYTPTNTNVSTSMNGNRYFRYKMLLQTASSTLTPSVSDASVTFASDCVPPGQVLFTGMSSGSYGITASLAGYAPFQDTVSITSSWQSLDVTLTPGGGGGSLN